MNSIDPKPKEVWLVNWDWDQAGTEIDKPRPAIVVGKDVPHNTSMRIVLPLTTWQERFKNMVWMFHLSNQTTQFLINDSAVNTYQIKCYDIQRFQKRLVNAIDDKDFDNTINLAKFWLS